MIYYQLSVDSEVQAGNKNFNCLLRAQGRVS